MMFRRIVLIALVWITSLVNAQTTAEMEANALLAREKSSAVAGSPSAATPAGATTTNKDIFSQFIAAIESLSQGDGQAITFDWKIPSNLFGRHVAKAQAVLRKPDLGKTVADKLKSNAEALAALQGELSYTDDVLLNFSISPMKKDAEKSAALAFARFAAPQYATIQNDVRSRVASLPSATRLQSARSSIANISDPVEADRVRADLATLEARAVEEETRREFVRQFRAPAADFAAAIANESKFNFDASYRSRRNTVGPNEWSVRASYERGIATPTIVSVLEQRRESDCARQYRSKDVAASCADHVQSAAGVVALDPNTQKQTRFSASVTLHQFAALDVVDTRYALDEHLDSSRSFEWKVAGGHDIYNPGPDPESGEQSKLRGRLELSVTYDDVRGDPKVTDRRDRLIGTLTYTQVITEKLQIPIALTYANHADYLTNVDRKLNAHFGLLYKIPAKK